MKHKFYDVKLKKSVNAEVAEAKMYGTKANPRFAFRAKTSDGRPLTCFVSKADFDKAIAGGVKKGK